MAGDQPRRDRAADGEGHKAVEAGPYYLRCPAEGKGAAG